MRHKKSKYTHQMVILLLLSFLFFVPSFAGTVSFEKDAQAKLKLSEIKDKEKETVEALFDLSSEIMLIDTEIKQINDEIASIKVKSSDKEKRIQEETVYYESVKKTLAKVLKSQQRAGITSNINVILQAENIKDLIRRINLLRQLSKNAAELIDNLEISKAVLTKEQEELAEIVIELETQQNRLQETHAQKLLARQDLEAYLESLQNEKDYYESYLNSVEDVWKEMKAILSETIQRFTEIIETGALPDDTVEVKRLLFGAKGIIEQDKFNDLLAMQQDLPQLYFTFYSDKVTLSFPEYEFYVEGTFILEDDQTIKYVVNNGTFYDLPLSKSAMKELFSEGDLVFSLELLIGDNRIKRIEYYDGRIELLIHGSQF